MDSDKQLVELVLKGDRDAFRRLYDLYAALIRRVCYDKTGKLADAQDLTQDVFVRAFKKLHTLEDPNKFVPWLIGIAKRASIDWHRREARDRHQFVDEVPDNTVVERDNDRAELVRREIRKLDEKERLALHLFYLQDEPVEKARQILGLSRSGFYRLLERARERLGELISVHNRGDSNV